jgi:hypothetical protein
MEEAGAESILEDFIIVCEFNLVDGVLMLVYFFFEFDQDVVQVLPALVKFGKVIDQGLIFLGYLDVGTYLLHD